MSIFKKTYELPLGRNYVRHWGMAEAVREIIQNAIDSESPFDYELTDDMLRVHSVYTTLSPSTLLLGSTTKAEAVDKIGSFGEGYKIALLVLARNNYKVRMLNGDRIWTPRFKMSNQFDAEVLCIEDTACPEEKNEGLTFEVSGLSPGDVASIRESCLMMQNVGEVIDTQFGRILYERPGKLYVGGLFVCETKLKYGYDVLPRYLRLERDRQTVSGWDMKSRTRDMWFDTERYDEVAKLLEAKTEDVEYAEFGAPKMVKEACFRLFQEKHPNAVVAKDQEEMEALVKEGMTNVVYVGGAYGSMIQESDSYVAAPRVPVKSPYEVLQDWLDECNEDLTIYARSSFTLLIEKAKAEWRLK